MTQKVSQADVLAASQGSPESLLPGIQVQNGPNGGSITLTLDQLEALISRREQRSGEVDSYDPHSYLTEAANKDQTIIPYREPHPTKKGEFVIKQYISAQHQYPRMVYHPNIPLATPVAGEPGKLIPHKQKVVYNDRELADALTAGFSLEPIAEDELSRARRAAGEAEESGRVAHERVQFLEGTEPDPEDPDNVEARLCAHCRNHGHYRQFCPVAIEEAAGKRRKAA
jgi:hypothetical protein